MKTKPEAESIANILLSIGRYNLRASRVKGKGEMSQGRRENKYRWFVTELAKAS